jgi:tubulin polyglutamylase TTLL9
MVKNLKRHKK